MRSTPRLIAALCAVVTATLAGAVTIATPAHAAGARPLFQLPFECRQSWRLQTYAGHDDYDIDMYRNDGPTNASNVVASAGGTVTFAGWDNGGGNMVKINHGSGWETMYLHLLNPPSVSTNQTVLQGQFLGRVGATGAAGGTAHLHYEQLKDGHKTESYFDGVPSGITHDNYSYVITPRISRNSCRLDSLSGDTNAEILSKEGGTIYAFRNHGYNANGTVNWGTKVAIGWGWNNIPSSAVKFADLDGDGHTEIISKEGHDIYALRNHGYNANGTVNWGAKVAIGWGWGAIPNTAVYFADLDGDGRSEIISNEDGTIYAFRNHGYNPNGTVNWGTKTAIGWGWEILSTSSAYFA